jgi:membrane protein
MTGERPSMWTLAKKSVTAWSDDYASSMGAALAYYTLFSLSPLLLLVIGVAGLVFGADAARGAVVAQIGGLIGQEGSVAIQGLLKGAEHPAASLVASIVGIVTLIVGATSIFSELQSDLDRIWRAPAAKRPAGVWGLVRTRLLSFGLIVSMGFLLLVSLVVSAGLAAFGKWYAAMLPGWAITIEVVNQVVSLAFITALFAMMYRILPSVRVAWRDVWLGSFVTAALFTIGKFLIGLYIGKAGVASGFGAAGSIVVMLVWVFYSAQIFLLGAEFTWIYAHEHGSRVAEPDEKSAPAHAGAPSDAPRRPQPAFQPRAARAALPPAPRHAGDAAIAGIVWAAFGAVRSVMSRWGSRSKNIPG